MATKALIIDYSWSGTTAKLATALQRVTGGDRVDLTVAVGTFPHDMYATSDVANRQLTTHQLPALTNAVPDVGAYDVLLVGGPVWSGKVSTPVRSFLQQLANFSGIVAPFYTNAGMPGDYEADFASLIPAATVVPGIGLTAGELRGVDRRLTRWWQRLATK